MQLMMMERQMVAHQGPPLTRRHIRNHRGLVPRFQIHPPVYLIKEVDHMPEQQLETSAPLQKVGYCRCPAISTNHPG